MNNDKGESRSEADISEPPHVEQFAWQEKLAMSEEKLKRWEQVVKLMRRISPAGERLTFEQALNLARRQAETYESFLATRAPISALEVRVGAKKILGTILNRPDGIRELTFRRAFPEDTLLQIWRPADKQFDEVPLLFQELQGIPHTGVSRTELYANGQSVTLHLTKEQNGEFNIKLSFAVEGEPLPTPRKTAVLEEEAAKAETAKPKSIGHAPGKQMAMAAGSSNSGRSGSIYGVAGALPVLLICAFWLGGHYSPYLKANRSVTSGTGTQSELAQNSNSVERDNALAPAESETGEEAPPQQAEDMPTVEQQQQTVTCIRRGVLARVEIPITPDDSTDPSLTPILAPAPEATFRVDGQDEFTVRGMVTGWDMQREARLASLRQVYVEELNGAALDKDSKLHVRAAFIRVLQGEGIEVLADNSLEQKRSKQSADGIIRLRFEPDKIFKGAVFAELRDSKGQYIWDDKAGCKTTVRGDMDAILSDASQRLGILMVSAIQQAQSNVSLQQVSMLEE